MERERREGKLEGNQTEPEARPNPDEAWYFVRAQQARVR